MNMNIRIDGWWKPKEDWDLTRPIHFSTHNRHMIKFNLEKSQNPNAVDSFGRTPLIIACLIQSRKRETKALLDAGANVNCLWECQNPYCKLSPLALVIHFQNLEMSKYLLNRGADPNLEVFNGFTALHLAVTYQQTELVGCLIDAGADTNAKDNFGYTPLHLAALFSTKICKMLLEVDETKVNSCGCDGETPLHIAAYTDRLDNVKLFVERQAYINYEMRGHWTPIECSPSKSTVRQYLQDRNAECKKCFENDSADWSPFRCYLPSPLIDLLKAIAPVLTSPNNSNFNKFKRDAPKFKIPETRTKIGRPLDQRCPPAYIDPPWFWIPPVTDFPNLGIRYIMNNTLKKQLPASRTSYEYIKKKLENELIVGRKQHFQCLMQLINMWGSFTVTNDALTLAGFCLSLLLDVGVDVNLKDERGCTPLFALIEDGYESAAVFMLNNGADPNLRVNGITPLMLAGVRGLKQVVFALLEKGADVHAQDKHGSSALHMASYYSLFNPPDIIAALIANGAEINAQSQSGVTPLHLSAVSMSTDRCRLLLNAGAYIDAKVFDLQAEDLAFIFMNIPAAAILKLSGDMFKSVLQCDLYHLEKHLGRGAVVNCQRSDYGTPLMCVTTIPLTLFAILLLKYDPDYEIKDESGHTAIQHAVCKKNYVTLAVFFKKWGIDMLFKEGNEHHIDNLIQMCEESKKPDWTRDNEMLMVLRAWKHIYEEGGKKKLEKLINAHFYDYVGFATLMLKFGWGKAMKLLRRIGSTVY